MLFREAVIGFLIGKTDEEKKAEARPARPQRKTIVKSARGPYQDLNSRFRRHMEMQVSKKANRVIILSRRVS